MERPPVSPALAELLARDGELDRIMERGLTFDSTPAPPLAPPPPTAREIIEPVDWEQELAERQATERAEAARALTEQVQQELARRAESERPDPPKRRWRP